MAMLCLGEDGAESEKVEMATAAAAVDDDAGPEAADDSSSSDGDADDGQDESQYRITVPLDVRLGTAPPLRLFAAASRDSSMPVTHSRLPRDVPLPAAASAGVPPTAVRPLLSAASRPVDLMSLPLAAAQRPPSRIHHNQQLMLPARMPAPLVMRCRDYDGQSLFIYLCEVAALSSGHLQNSRLA